MSGQVMKHLVIGSNIYDVEDYTLPIASSSTLGGIKVGSGLSIDASTGVLTASGTSVTIDTAMSDSSTNPVQNKVIKAYSDGLIAALDGGTIGTPGAGKTVTSVSQTDGNISIGFSDISITKSQVSDFSHAHGNITSGGDITATAPTIANGDQLVINDNSASKITNGPTFDGSTTTKALSQKGTWETFLTEHQSLSGYVPTSRTINSKALTSNITLSASDVGASASDHTHTLSIASDTGTSSLSMSANTKYKLTAGGETYIFTTPSDTTYESKSAASGGTAVSLVTTGEKYTWNNKSNLTIGTTAGTAAEGNHTHTLTIASDSGTSALDMTANTKYKITAGGSTYIFKTPAGGSTYTAGTGLTLNGTAFDHSNSVTAQTTSKLVPIKFDAQGHITDVGSEVTSLPASDVSAWAKAANKPSYTYSEVGAAASSHSHGNITDGGDITATAPTIANGDQLIINDNSTSKITNGPTFDGSTTTKALTQKGTWETFLQSFTETDPTVPSWAKASSKPTYTYSEVGAAASSHDHGNITSGGDITATAPTIASGDQIVINDSSASKITNGPTFDGSTTTKALSQKGTWETFLTEDSDENVKSTAVTAATTNYIVGSTTSTTTTGTLSKHASAVLYTTADTATSGYTQLRLGNNTATSSAGGREGQIRLYGTNATYYVDLKAGAVASSNKTITLPNATGTVALTSDIVDEKVKMESTDFNTDYRLLGVYTTTSTTETGTANKLFDATYNSNNSASILKIGGARAGNLVLTAINNNVSSTTTIQPSNTTDRTITLPDKTGTVALTSDTTTVQIVRW